METDPTFTKCMVKKSKHYYKEILKTVGILLGLFVICMAGFFGLYWLSSYINFSGSAISAMVFLWVIIIGVISIVSAIGCEYFWISLIKFFIAIHIFIVLAILLVGIWLICFMGIPIMIFYMIYLFAFTFFSNSLLIGIIMGIISIILVLPVNWAMFECFKIDEFINDTWLNITRRLDVWLK